MSTAAQKATHTRRLKRLADILARFRPVSGKRFNMNTWGRHDGSHHPEKEKDFCGTAACALGHAALDPAFRRAGLKIRWEATRKYDHSVWPPEPTDEVAEYLGNISFRGKFDEEAGATFFGLSLTEAYDLFLQTSRSRMQVVARLRRYAKRRAELA